MPMKIGVCTTLAVCLGAACAREKPQPDSGAVQSPRGAAPGGPSEWVVTPRGLGPLRAGMSRAAAEEVVGGSLAINGDSAWKDCAYTPTDRLPPGVRVMVDGGTIARVDIDSGRIATAEGARIGDSEDRIRQLYAGRVVTTPHKYTDGHYLTVRPVAGEDTLYRIVFETDSGRVTVFRAGRLPPVGFVEGCG